MEYQSCFEELQPLVLLRNLELQDTYFIDNFIGGLRDEIKNTVTMFKPRPLNEAINLTNLQEATINSCNRLSHPHNKPVTTFAPSRTKWSSTNFNPRSILPQGAPGSSVTVSSKLSSSVSSSQSSSSHPTTVAIHIRKFSPQEIHT